jgi:hypothetical protein
MPPTEALQRLEISTSPLDTPPAGTLLNLSEVPPGDYRLRLRFASEAAGDISLLVGRDGGPLATWPVSAPEDLHSFRLPVRASSVTIAGDAAAAASLRSVALIPIGRVTTPGATAMRARVAARYGHAVVYAIDNRIIIERDGFWVLGGRQPDVVIATDSARAELTVEVSNVSVHNRIRVSSGAWSATRELAPDERWRLAVPLSYWAQYSVVNFRVEQGTVARGRFLGCRVSIVR